MAKRRKRRKKSISGYFREVFRANPHWLQEKSNNAVVAKYRADHGMAGDAVVSKSAKSNLANIKSQMRKDLRGTGKSPKHISVTLSKGSHRLEPLEELIDECLSMAKNLD